MICNVYKRVYMRKNCPRGGDHCRECKTSTMEAASTVSEKKAAREIPSLRTGIDWSIAAPLLLAHVIALAAPFTVTWSGLVLMLALYVASGLGVTAGAHRLLTHASFQASPLFRRLLAILFLIAAQGSLLRWVRDHHIHHRYSDAAGDPHSPHMGHGFWYAQLTWLWKTPPSRAENKQLYEQYGGGLWRDAFLRRFSTGGALVAIHVALMALVFSGGVLWQGAYTGLSWLIWGVFLRIVLVLHATSLVNSATHLWGYRTYATREESRNNWWVAILSLGEGWHNNHHNRPGTANQGFHRWWEFDFTFCFLVVAGWLGLASNLRVYRARTGKTEIWFARKPRRPQSHPASQPSS
jgi:fatty-acid desaturase